MTSKINIIGISGTNGSGKDTAAHILSRRLNYQFVSFGDILRQTLIEQKIEPIRRNTRKLSSSLEHQFGSGVLVDMALNKFKPSSYDGLIVASVRNEGEAQRIKDLDGKIIWMDADISVRYGRIHNNVFRKRNDDNLSFDEFKKQEDEELTITPTNDNMNLMAVQPFCEIKIYNDGGLDDLEQKLAEYFPV